MTVGFQSGCQTDGHVSQQSPLKVRGCGGNLFVVGRFTTGDGNDLFNSAVLRNEFVSFFKDEDPRIDSELWSAVMYKKKLYTGGTGNGGLNVLNKETKKWDIVGGGVGTGFLAIFSMTVWNDLLVFCGNFEDVDGIPHTARICAWNGEEFVSLLNDRFVFPNPPNNGQLIGVCDNVVNLNGMLIATPQFFYIDGDNQGTGWYAQFVGGSLGTAWQGFASQGDAGNGVTVHNNLLWSTNTAEVKSTGGDLFVTTGTPLAVFSIDDELWAVGDMTVIDGVNCNRVAKYVTPNPAKQIAGGWVAVGDGLGATVRCVFKYKKVLYVGGDFTQDSQEDTPRPMRLIAQLDEKNDRWIPATSNEIGGMSAIRVAWMIEEKA